MKNSFIVYDKHVAFWGSEFSNFYPCKFTYLGKEFKSSEQAFMYEKALFFKDNKTAELILNANTPKEAKALGRQVANYDDEIWAEAREDIMYNVVLAKFTQNSELGKLITKADLSDKTFVEGSYYDGIWGVKMDYRNPDIDNEENWKGQNLLGKVLNRVREFIIRCL